MNIRKSFSVIILAILLLVGSVATYAQTKFQYLIDTYSYLGLSAQGQTLQADMNKRGAEGWELVSVKQDDQSIIVIYKRPSA